MKRYFTNLLVALLDRDPYAMELAQAREEYELTARRVLQMEEAEAKWREKLAEAKKRLDSYQNLTENLRQRIVEKDVFLDQVKRDYNATIDRLRGELQEKQTEAARQLASEVERHEQDIRERDEKIAGLREDLDDTLERLQNANQALAHDLMAQQMLDKTMNALDDLYATMQSGDAEQIRAFTEKLEWCNPLLRIAQRHIMVLRRKNELEERLRLANSRHDDNFNLE